VRGRDGLALDDVWQGSPHAYRGTAVPGFPNLFLLLGPNTGLGHSSMVYMIESQVNYVAEALKAARGRVVEVRADAEAAYNDSVDGRLGATVWSTGCSSWYADSTGRISALWPDWTFRFRRDLAHFDAEAYEMRTAPVPTRMAVPA
jgi:hypothetical protein